MLSESDCSFEMIGKVKIGGSRSELRWHEGWKSSKERNGILVISCINYGGIGVVEVFCTGRLSFQDTV